MDDFWAGMPTPVRLPARFVRPPIHVPVFVDDAGEPIRYGQRWPDHQPPKDAYSRLTHQERFAPLPTVADALVAWLLETFDAAPVQPGIELWRNYSKSGMQLSSVTLVPASPCAASLTVVTTSMFFVIVGAGASFAEVIPDCSCDACDETAESAADELERLVRAIVSGGFAERLEGDSITQLLRYEPGPREAARGGPSYAITDADRQRVAHMTAQLKDGRWEPWPLREQTGP